TFAGVMLFTAMAQSLTVQDTANGSLMASAPVAVTPGAVYKFVIAAPASASASKPFSITVTVFDQYGNLEANYTGTITFTSSDPTPALLPADYTFTPGDNGTQNFGVVFFTRGAQTLIVTDTESGVAST